MMEQLPVGIGVHASVLSMPEVGVQHELGNL